MRATWFILAGLVILFVVFGRGPKERDYLFSMKTSSGLHKNEAITYLGVKVGHIEEIRLSADGEGVVAAAFITDPQMKLRQGDTARVAFPSFFGTGEIQILRTSEGAAELAEGSTIPVAAPPEDRLSPAKMS